MLCIKEKCKYYKEHDFMASIGECWLGPKFRKDREIQCEISKEIKALDERKKELKKYRKYIEKNQ